MTYINIKVIPKLHKAPQPPLSYPGAAADCDRAKKPRLSEPSAADHELNPGDRVEGLGNFGEPTGKFGTVEQVNEEDAVVKWDDASRVRLHQPWLKKVWPATTLGPSAKSEASPLSSGQLLSEPVAKYLPKPTLNVLMAEHLVRLKHAANFRHTSEIQSVHG